MSVLGLCISCEPSPRTPAAGESAFDVIELTISQAHRAIETNFISCEGLTRRYLKRIEAYDQSTGLNAIIRINPNALSRVPAGSSGGTASAIAANFGIIGMGTDTGNPIRGPASRLALVGIRSTMGATGRDGIVPLLLNRDVGGPMARTVLDTANAYSVIAGYDPQDPVTESGKSRLIDDYTTYLRADGLEGVHLGVLRALFDEETTDPEVLAPMSDPII